MIALLVAQGNDRIHTSRAARRQIARERSQGSSNNEPPVKTAGSVGLTPYSMVRSIRIDAQLPARPRPTPAAPRSSARPTTISAMRFRLRTEGHAHSYLVRAARHRVDITP